MTAELRGPAGQNVLITGHVLRVDAGRGAT
jgi:hypothetical protein